MDKERRFRLIFTSKHAFEIAKNGHLAQTVEKWSKLVGKPLKADVAQDGTITIQPQDET